MTQTGEPSLPTTQGDAILSRLLTERGTEQGDLANRLLGEIHAGYPIAKLRLLLRAQNAEAVSAGIWIASELGSDARPVFAEIVARMHDAHPRVRFFALDCMISCAVPEDREALHKSLDLVADSDPSVRWKAMHFLTAAAEPLLRAARLDAMTSTAADARVPGLELLLRPMDVHVTEDVVAYLDAGDDVMRCYAAAAAARIVHRDATALLHAMQSSDATIRQFAADMAKRVGSA